MVVRLVALMAVLAVCCSPAESATRGNSVGKDKPEVERRFDELYRAYKEAPGPTSFSSLSYSEEQHRYLRKMVELGSPATPYLMKKLRETRDINLVYPVAAITGKRFKDSDWLEARRKGAKARVDMYLDWWESKEGACAARTAPNPPQLSIKATFEQLYQNYREAPGPRGDWPWSISREELRYLHQMKELGPAVTPCIMKKLKKTEDYKLIYPLGFVTKKRFKAHEWPEGEPRCSQVAVPMYIDWWESKVDNARSEFEEAYSRWQEAKSSESWPVLRTKRYVYDSEHQRIREEEELTEAGKALHSMEMMGVVALPYVMEHLREGDHDLLVLAERLTGDAVRAGGRPKARAEKYLAWWKKNERKWNILAARRRAQEEDDKEAAG